MDKRIKKYLVEIEKQDKYLLGAIMGSAITLFFTGNYVAMLIMVIIFMAGRILTK